MSGNSGERESRRARKRRRKERERQLQASAAPATDSQLGIRDVFLPAEQSDDDSVEIADQQPEQDFEVAEADHDEQPDETPADAPAVTAGEESPSQQVAALQHELQEKDELLNALTEQLEEAANRLDRLHRAGADRGPRVRSGTGDEFGTGGEIGEQLARLCNDWDDLQPSQQFEEVRNRLDEIYDAVTRRSSRSQGIPGEQEPESDRPSSSSQSGGTDSASSLPGWEAMKAELLREGAGQSRSHDELEDAVDDVSDKLDSAAKILSEIPLEPPEPVDLEHADHDTLVAAVEERDVFISHLIERLRSGSSGGYAPVNWAEISDAPDELRERLQEHEARLQELLRMEECDLSLERARLARERARLEQLRRDVERDARGGELEEEGSDRNERRWLRVFGFGRRSDGEPGDE